jgi:hypothetical protein
MEHGGDQSETVENEGKDGGDHEQNHSVYRGINGKGSPGS